MFQLEIAVVRWFVLLCGCCCVCEAGAIDAKPMAADVSTFRKAAYSPAIDEGIRQLRQVFNTNTFIFGNEMTLSWAHT